MHISKKMLLKLTVIAVLMSLIFVVIQYQHCNDHSACNAQESSDQICTISHFSWGKVIVSCAGKEYTFKDCKISPKGPQTWDWNEFKTRHVPGIQVQDLKSIIDDCDIIILSRGVDLVLETKPDTFAYLKKLNKEVHWLQSEAAVKLYNELIQQQKRVGILLHSTC